MHSTACRPAGCLACRLGRTVANLQVPREPRYSPSTNPLVEFDAESLLDVHPEHRFRALERGLGLLAVRVANGRCSAAARNGIGVAQHARLLEIDTSQSMPSVLHWQATFRAKGDWPG
jgi:hypothetical protein